MSCNCETSLPYKTKEEHTPFLDSLGPFHDETILSSIDRILYFLGVHKLFNLHTLTTEEEPTIATCNCVGNNETRKNEDDCKPCSSGRSIKKDSKESVRSAHSVRSVRSVHSVHSAQSNPIAQTVRFLSHPMVREIICPICGANSDGVPDTSKLESMLNKMDSYTENPIASTLRRSLSLCSLACRKIKKGLSSSNFSTPKSTKWFWTRRREQNCHQIFEIYQNSDMSTQPSTSRLRKNLTMILVVTPNGNVVPFEPVKTHF